MEHRCGSRGTVHYPITLLTAERHHIHGVLQNLGAGGAYITGLSCPVCRHQLVDVVLRKPEARLIDAWQWPAMVLRCDEDAAALMFDRMRFAELHPILAVLRQAERTRGRRMRDAASGLAGARDQWGRRPGAYGV